MQMVAYQPELSPELPVVIGNVDYHQYRITIERIDQLLLNSGIERTFIQYYLFEAERLGREYALSEGKKYRRPGQEAIVRLEIHASRALRCNIVRSLESISYRKMSRRLADSPLLQRFCGISRMGVIKVPSKSTIERYAKDVPESMVRDIVNQLAMASTLENDCGQSALGLESPVLLSNFLMDTTCVKANIHFPVDWVLLRDAARTLLKAIQLIRNQGLKNRMAPPADFARSVNKLCIEMTHSRRRKDGPKSRKKILRLLKKTLRRIDLHARKHQVLLASSWQETDLSEKQATQIIARIERICEQLPTAIHQAHERIIGGRRVPNKDKIFSLYEPDINVLVRGKAGAEVEFGNTLLLVEQQDGLLVDWDFLLRNRSDSPLVEESLNRFQTAFGFLPNAVVTDRGFDSPGNRDLLAENDEMYNAICPKSPLAFQEKMKDPTFCELQKRRSQNEGRMGIFKNGFLGRPMRSKGFVNRELNISWSVLAHNLWVLARLPWADENQNRLTLAA